MTHSRARREILVDLLMIQRCRFFEGTKNLDWFLFSSCDNLPDDLLEAFFPFRGISLLLEPLAARKAHLRSLLPAHCLHLFHGFGERDWASTFIQQPGHSVLHGLYQTPEADASIGLPWS